MSPITACRLSVKALVCSAVLLGQMGGAIAQTPVGILVKTSSFQATPDSLNLATLTQRRVVMEETVQERGVEYVDNCPRGKKALGYAHTTDYGSNRLGKQSVVPSPIGRSEVQAWFMSQKTPPAPGLRVVIRNTSLSQPIDQRPYTDREYDKAPHSEEFVIAENAGHHGRFFAVKLGANDFVYEIKRGDQVIESGQFTATFSQQYRDVMRIVTIPRPKFNLACVDDK